MILDTNAVSALFAGNDALKEKLMKSHKHHLPLIVSGEYRFGLLGSSKRKLLESLLQTLEKESYLLTLDVETSELYAQIRRQLKADGTPIPENDIWIAALAMQFKLPILSQDKHFDCVQHIRRVSW